MSAKTKKKIIENRDNKIIHERREETVKSSFLDSCVRKVKRNKIPKRPFSAPISHLVCSSKLICKLSQKRQALASGSRSK